jgi:hypothetical protein
MGVGWSELSVTSSGGLGYASLLLESQTYFNVFRACFDGSVIVTGITIAQGLRMNLEMCNFFVNKYDVIRWSLVTVKLHHFFLLICLSSAAEIGSSLSKLSQGVILVVYMQGCLVQILTRWPAVLTDLHQDSTLKKCISKNCCILFSDKPTWCGFKCSSPYNWVLAYTKRHTKVQYSYCSS